MKQAFLSEELFASLSGELKDLLSGYGWAPVLVGRSTASVFCLRKKLAPSLYLKVAARGPESELRAEAAKLAWIAGRIPTPRVLAYLEDYHREYLLTSALPGRDASVWCGQENPAQFVQLLAQGMRMIHSLATADCPFDQTLTTRIAAARDRVRRGLVDEEDFDPPRRGKTAPQILAQLMASRPEAKEVVFTHGDYCLPNIIVTQGRLSGFVDWSRGGLADRYQDMALAARSLIYNLSPEWVPLLFKAYGLEQVDAARLEFYTLLDEFF